MSVTSMSTVDPDFVVIVCHVPVASPVENAWPALSRFAEAGRFLNVTCLLTSGDGGVGSLRTVAGTIVEVMVGSTPFSYTYAQIVGPMAQFSYHGCLSVSPVDASTCDLSYTIVYDQSSMDAESRASERDRIAARFQGAIEGMKRLLEMGNPTP